MGFALTAKELHILNIFPAVLFSVSGALSICGGRTNNGCYMTASLVLSIASSVAGATVLISYSTLAIIDEDGLSQVSLAFLIITVAAMLLLGVASSVVACRPLLPPHCWGSIHEDTSSAGDSQDSRRICVVKELSFKNWLSANAATILGAVHILCAIISFGAELGAVAPKSLEPKTARGLGLGIWTSLVYFTSGSLAISSRAGIVCHVVANLVMFTISALSGLGLLVYSCLLEARGAHNTRWGAPSTML